MAYFSNFPPERKYLHVAFTWALKTKTEELRQLFDNAIEWMRYAPNCWILYTDQSPQWWYEKIRHHMTKADRVLICDIDISNKQGWQEKWVWEWLNKSR